MRQGLVVALVVLVLIAPLSAASTLATPTDTSSKTHTLVIKQGNGSVGYTVTVSGTITIEGNETGDSITGTTASGRVGGLPWEEKSSDRKDVIQFTGQLQDFEYDSGQIQVVLDGKQINPDALVGTPPPPPPTATPTTTTTETPTAAPTPEPITSTPAPSSGGDDGEGWLSLDLIVVLLGVGVVVLLFLRRV